MNELIINENNIQDKIYTVRNLQVMLDEDLAELYGVEIKVFNQAIKRNIERFSEKFRFQVTQDEYEILRSQVTLESQRVKHRKYMPYVFTEQGVSMLSAVLRSKTAIQVSIKIIDTFVKIRKIIAQIGVSLKDLGKKWFGFSRMDKEIFKMMGKLGKDEKNSY